MEIVPQMWLLTKRVRSRIFQGLTVPDILDMVFKGKKLATESAIRKGPCSMSSTVAEVGGFQETRYCVQYRETDFNFACRVMEEEASTITSSTPARASTMGRRLSRAFDHLRRCGGIGDLIVYTRAASTAEAKQELIYDWSKVQNCARKIYVARSLV